MITLRVLKHDGTKEIAHFQNMEKCAKWINLYYHKFTEMTLTELRSKDKHVFKSKLDFELFYEKRTK